MLMRICIPGVCIHLYHFLTRADVFQGVRGRFYFEPTSVRRHDKCARADAARLPLPHPLLRAVQHVQDASAARAHKVGPQDVLQSSFQGTWLRRQRLQVRNDKGEKITDSITRHDTS